MENILNITLIQPDIAWLDIHNNLKKFENLIQQQMVSTDLILLPEMFATGFIVEPEMVIQNDQKFLMKWMVKMAKHFNCCVGGSHPYYHNGTYYNRFLVAFADGNIVHYNKRHLFTMGGEEKNYSRGDDRIIFSITNWQIMPLICYDLRFPVWSRNNLKYDLLVYCANWPKARDNVWELLLKARAIENQCYVAGVNRIGIDGRSIQYMGQSQVISPKGDILGSLDQKEGLLNVTLDKVELEKFRTEFPVLNDADEFTIK